MRRSLYTKAFWTVGLLLLAAFLGVAAAACGSETASGAESSSEPIKIGVPVAISGPYAGDGQNSLQGIEFAVSEINAKGGLLGRQLKIVKFDTQDLSPERVSLAADTLVEKEKVDVNITGWAGSGGDVQAFGKYDPVPFFQCDAQQVCVDVMNKGGYSNIWMGCETEADTGADAWQFISWLPYKWPNKKVAIIVSDDPWAAAVYDTIQAAAEADGWTVVSRDKVPFGTTQWDAILTRIRTKDPALIMFDIQSATDMLTFVEAFKEQPTNSIVHLGMGLPVREFQEAAAGKLDGFIGVTHLGRGLPIPAKSEGQNAWLEAFTKQFGVRPGGLAGVTYTCTRAWAAAVEAVGDPSDYKAINEWLASNEFAVWDGMPLFKFDANHVNRSDYTYWGQMHGDEMLTLSNGGKAYSDFQDKTYEFQVPSWIKQ